MQQTERSYGDNPPSSNLSDAEYRQVFEFAHDMIVLVDKDGNILDINKRAEQLLGYRQDELRHMNTFEHLYVPEDRSMMRQIIDHVVSGQQQQYEVRWLTKDDRVVYLDGASVPRYGSDGVFISTICCLRDITARKKLEQSLKESDALHRVVLSNISDTVLITNEIGQFTFICPNVHAIFGHSADEVAALANITHLLGVDFTQNVQLAEVGELTNILRVITDKFGSSHQVLVNIKRVSIGAGTWLFTCRDVTDFKRIEAAHLRSEQLFAKIFQAVPVAIGIISATTHRLLNINQYALELTGFERAEVLEKPVPEVPFWTDSQQWDQVLQPILDGGAFYGHDMEWRTRSGKLLNMLGSTVQVYLDDEPYLLGIALDVTERKQAEKAQFEAQQLQLQLKQEREILALKERFISLVSHEFRTPLAVILSSTETLSHYRDRLTPERQRQKLQNIEEQVKYLVSLLDEVLLIGQSTAGELQFTPTEIDLVEYCRGLFEEVQSTDSLGHRYVFHADVPNSTIYADRVLLRHILLNLLSNAIKYTPVGGEVRFEIEQHGENIRFRISDQGIGIPEADQPRLFERFHRATNTGLINGTGLGLAIVKESVDAYGGMITYESHINAGTTFTVQLPVFLSRQ